MRSLRDDEFKSDVRGAANTLGYVLMIGIFLAGGLSLFVVSITVFSDAGGNEITDAEEQMQKLQGSFNSFVDGAPSKEVTLQGNDVTMRYGDPVSIEVEARENPDGSASTTGPCGTPSTYCSLGQADITPLVYDIEQGQIEYVNGALLLAQGDDSGVVKSSPPWFIGEYTRFPLLNTTQSADSSGSIGISGTSGSFRVAGYRQDIKSTNWTPNPGDPDENDNLQGKVTLSGVNNIDAWEAYFSGADPYTVDNVDRSTDTISATFTTDRIIVREIPINVEYKTGG